MAVNNNLTTAFRDVIIKEDLIDTGRLLKSIRVFVDIKGDIIKINVVGRNYIKYFITPRNLLGQFQSNNLYTVEVTALLQELLDIKIYNLVNNTGGTNFNPRVQIYVNGR